jgi:hypothetical protein
MSVPTATASCAVPTRMPQRGHASLCPPSYDTKDRLTVRTDPLSHTDTINTYDGNDNVLTATYRKGQGITYTYER